MIADWIESHEVLVNRRPCHRDEPTALIGVRLQMLHACSTRYSILQHISSSLAVLDHYSPSSFI